MKDGKSFKDTPLGMIVVLTVTAVIVAGALAGFFELVKDRIEANRLAEEKRAIFAVLPAVVSYETIEVEATIDGKLTKMNIFKGRGADGEAAGYAFLAKHPGYAAVITMMVGLSIDRETLTGLKVTDQIETPGLGDKISKEPFEAQFRGLAIKPKVVYIKNKKPSKPNEIQAVSGATISSKAVTTAVNKTVTAVLKVLPPDDEPAPVDVVAGEDGPSPTNDGDNAEGETEDKPKKEDKEAEAGKVKEAGGDGDK